MDKQVPGSLLRQIPERPTLVGPEHSGSRLRRVGKKDTGLVVQGREGKEGRKT